MRFILVGALTLGLSSVVWADTYYCPKTFRYVNTGDSEQDVRQNCGEPSSERTYETSDQQLQTVTQWFYRDKTFTGPQQDQPQAIFTFNAQKQLSEIQIGTAQLTKQTVTSTSFCKGGNVSLNMTQLQVNQICGGPDLRNTAQRQTEGPKRIITEWTYSFGPYQPRTILQFEGGRLTQINTSGIGPNNNNPNNTNSNTTPQTGGGNP
ncbi:MAG: hypothetical protein Tsb005_03750 [Gammaproteobacteria bacterium]